MLGSGLQVARVPSVQIGLHSDLGICTAEVTMKPVLRMLVVLELQAFYKMVLTGVDCDRGAV